MRKISLIVVTLAALGLTPFASAGSVRPPQLGQLAQGVLGLLFNAKWARGQQTETTAGKLSFNVYAPDDKGEWSLIDVWDGNDGRALAWTDDAALEPVVGINRIAGDPREVQYWIDSSKGNSTVFYAANKGGRRGKNGQATDNSGYRNNIPWIRVRDLPQGKIFIGARWGNGSAIAEFVHIDVAATYKKVIENERIRAALAGAGGAVFPATPIMTLIIDGKPQYVMNDEELKAVMAKLNGQGAAPIQDTQGQTGNGNNPPQRTVVDPPVQQPTSSAWSFEVRRDFYVKNEVWEMHHDAAKCESYLRDMLLNGSQVLPDNVEYLEIDQRYSLAILVTSDRDFSVSCGSDSWKTVRRAGRYECLVMLRHDPSSIDSRFTVRQDGRTRQFRFKEVGQ